jgi:hypothetical protein
MAEKTIYFLDFIIRDFFTAFGLFTILYLFLSLFIKNPFLNQIDEEATKFISFIGILYLILFFTGTLIELNILTGEEKSYLLHRMFGKYWFGFWMQPFLWVLTTQLLRLKKVRKNILLRLLFSLLLILSIERLVILYTTFQRDYLPSSWTMYNADLPIYPSNLILAILMKICVFLLFVGVFGFVNKKPLTH